MCSEMRRCMQSVDVKPKTLKMHETDAVTASIGLRMYAKASVFRKRFSVHPCTLRRWADAGKLRFVRSPGGTRLYELPGDAHGLPDDGPAKKKIVYARVSSAKQKDDLRRQVDFLSAKFPDHVVVTDVGSGVNWKRRGLLSVLDDADRDLVEEVVVASRDRLCRFAYELVEHVLGRRGVRIVVLETTDSSPERELSDDLLSIVQIFCRRNGTPGAGNRASHEEDQAAPLPPATRGPEPVR